MVGAAVNAPNETLQVQPCKMSESQRGHTESGTWKSTSCPGGKSPYTLSTGHPRGTTRSTRDYRRWWIGECPASATSGHATMIEAEGTKTRLVKAAAAAAETAEHDGRVMKQYYICARNTDGREHHTRTRGNYSNVSGSGGPLFLATAESGCQGEIHEEYQDLDASREVRRFSPVFV